MNKLIPAALAAIAIAGVAYYLAVGFEDTATKSPAEGEAMVAITIPETLSDQAEMGRRAYDSTCASCHGDNATGRVGVGPPLVHKIYEPSHHGDMSFQLAVQQGVRASLGFGQHAAAGRPDRGGRRQHRGLCPGIAARQRDRVG